MIPYTKRFRKILAHLPESGSKIKEINGTNHAFVTGDSLKILDYFPEGCIDLIITDPQYNRGLKYGATKDRMKKEKYYEWCKRWLEKCGRVLSQRGSFYLISYPENNARLLPFIEDKLKLKFKRWITWHYPTNIGHSKRNYTRAQRSILFFVKSDKYVFNKQHIIQQYKNPTVTKIKKRIMNGHKGRGSYDLLRFLDLIELSKGTIDIIDINLLKNTAKDRFTGQHPCQLPLTLLSIFAKVSSNKGAILLDPFAGTFTLSAVAAELGRHSIGIEINPKYVKLGLRRLKKI